MLFIEVMTCTMLWDHMYTNRKYKHIYIKLLYTP